MSIATPEVYNVSNSEVTAFLSCERMYYFAFGMNIAPKNLSVPLKRGSLGHLFFQRYAEARLAGHSHESAYKIALSVFNDSSLDPNVMMETMFICKRYMDYHQGWPQWEILGTEQRVDMQLTDTLVMPIRYDLLVREKATGKVIIVDYKFTYDFWSPDDHSLNGQMPKYVTVMQANGMHIDGGLLEEIRTRPLGKEKSAEVKNLWRRTPYYPSPMKKRNMLEQHVRTSLRIEKFRALPEAEQIKTALPILNKHGACKYCNFKDLCISMNEGKTDLSVDIRVGYDQNTYGYNKEIMEDIIG